MVDRKAALLFLLCFVLLLLGLCRTALAREPRIANVLFESCYDGDTCSFVVPWLPPVLGDPLTVRLRGIDTPEIRGRCDSERQLARDARDVAVEVLSRSRRIDLLLPERGKYFRLVVDVIADGESLADVLVRKGLARPYEGGRREGWCDDRR